MVTIEAQKVKEAFLKKNYIFFRGPYNLNICAVRAAARRVNLFDDKIYIFYENAIREICFECEATVDPGLPWLLSPMEPRMGTAAIAPGQYRGVWRLGEFRGEPALLQVRPFTCFRDNDRNATFSYSPQNTTSGIYGIHLHPHFQLKECADIVGLSSAGCVVPRCEKDFYEIIRLCKRQIETLRVNQFTFTLFDELELSASSSI